MHGSFISNCLIWLYFLALAVPIGRRETLEHKITKRNFVPNRFDIVDNEIKRKWNWLIKMGIQIVLVLHLYKNYNNQSIQSTLYYKSIN